MKKINIFPYYISDQPKEQQRYNLLLISEDAESKYHYCAIKNFNKLHYGQNRNTKEKHISVTAACMASQKNTYSTNTKKTVMALIKS